MSASITVRPEDADRYRDNLAEDNPDLAAQGLDRAIGGSATFTGDPTALRRAAVTIAHNYAEHIEQVTAEDEFDAAYIAEQAAALATWAAEVARLDREAVAV